MPTPLHLSDEEMDVLLGLAASIAYGRRREFLQGRRGRASRRQERGRGRPAAQGGARGPRPLCPRERTRGQQGIFGDHGPKAEVQTRAPASSPASDQAFSCHSLPHASDKRCVALTSRPIDGFALGLKGGEYVVGVVFDHIVVDVAGFWTAFGAGLNVDVRHTVFSSMFEVDGQYIKPNSSPTLTLCSGQ
jgi:hypothetical protein